MEDDHLVKSNVSNEDDNNYLKESVFEGVGVFFLVILMQFGKNQPEIFVPGLFILTLLFVKESGAHLNPAISFGFFFIDLKFNKMVSYVVAQLTGAMIAVTLAYPMNGRNLNSFVAPPNFLFLNGLFTETTFTALIMMAYLHNSTVNKDAKPTEKSLVVSAAVFSAYKAAASQSAPVLNPVLALSVNVLASTFDKYKQDYPLRNLGIFVLCPLLGACLASMLFKYVYLNMIEEKQNEKTKKHKELV